MRIYLVALLALVASAQTPSADHKTAAEITATLDKAGNVTQVGSTVTLVTTPAYHAVVRRRTSSGTPQNAIIHPKSSEVYQITEGSGVLVTGGVLDPAPGVAGTVQSANNITSTSIKGGKSERVAKGDILFVPAGMPHWFSSIDGSITYLEVQFDTK